MQNTIDLRDVLRTLNKRKGLIAAVFMICIIIAVIISYATAPTYEASATLRIKMKQGLGNSLLTEMASGMNMTKELMSTYAEMIKSRAVVEKVIERTWKPKGAEDKRPKYSAYAGAITTTPVRDTQILKISVKGPTPEDAKLRANTLVDTFNARLAELSQLEQKTVREFIGKRLDEIKTDLDKSEAKLTMFKSENQILSPNDETKAVLDNLKELDKTQAANIIRTIAAQAQLDTANRQLTEEAPGFIASSPLIDQLKGKIADLEVQKMMLLQQYTAKHPQVIAIQAALDEARSNLNQEAERVATAKSPSSNPVHVGLVQTKIKAEAEVEAGKAENAAIQTEVDKRMAKLTGMPDEQNKLLKLQRETNVTEQMYLMMSQRYEEARIQEVMTPRDVQVVDYAVEPDSPVAPKKSLNVMVAALLALFAGVGLAFLLDYYKKTIKTADDVEFYLKLPVLAQIPDYSVRSNRGVYGRLRKKK